MIDLAYLTSWTTLFFLSEWVIRLVMVVIVPMRRSPQAAKAWLLLIFVLPWIGLILYLLLSYTKPTRRRQARLAQIPEAFAGVVQKLLGFRDRYSPVIPSEFVREVRLTEMVGYFPLVGQNSAQVLVDYDGTIGQLVADIDAARDHVHLLYYIYADDAAAGRVTEALLRAARRGVRCRVLMDAIGSRRGLRRVGPRLRQAGVGVQASLPIGLLRLFWKRIDLRNHRKIAVIDGAIGYTGSQNLVDAKYKEGITYEELMVRVSGPVVSQLQMVFVADWFLETNDVLQDPEYFPEPVPAGAFAAQALPSGPDFPTENTQRLIVSLLYAARRRVVITTPYFIPDEALLQALEAAVLRGVEVHLVLSEKWDQLLVGLAQRSYYEELLELGVQIHLHRGKFLHAKHLSVDDKVALIGSTNMDIRSFELNAEISLLFYEEKVADRLRMEQERYFAGSLQLNPEEWDKRSYPVQLCENLARLLSPLL